MRKLILAATLTLAATAAQAQGTSQNSRPAQGTGGTSVQTHQQTNSTGTPRDTNTGGTKNSKN